MVPGANSRRIAQELPGQAISHEAIYQFIYNRQTLKRWIFDRYCLAGTENVCPMAIPANTANFIFPAGFHQ